MGRGILLVVLGLLIGCAAGDLYERSRSQPTPQPSPARPIKKKLGNPNDSPVHVQGGSIVVHCKSGWNFAPPHFYTCSDRLADSSAITFEDDNLGYQTQPPVTGRWTVTVHASNGDYTGQNPNHGIQLCSSPTAVSRACDEPASSRGAYVTVSPLSNDTLTLKGDAVIYSAPAVCPGGGSCGGMYSSDLSTNHETYPCERSNGCHIRIGMK